MRESFVIRHEMGEIFDQCSDEKAGKIIKALMDFSRYGVEPAFEGDLALVMRLMMNTLIRDNEAYEQRCKRNAEAAAKRWRKTPPKAEKSGYCGIEREKDGADDSIVK